MKGLLLKDFALIKNQKAFIGMIVAMGILFSFTQDTLVFSISYVTVIGAMLTLSTLSYDDFENGNAFLFTLPITKKGYILEKYIFGAICVIMGGSFITVFSYIIAFVRKLPEESLAFSAVMAAVVSLVIMALTFPLQLKFGAERSKMALVLVWVVIFVSGYSLIERMDQEVLEKILSIRPEMWMVMAVCVGIIVLWISYKISVGIMEKKEF